MNRNASNVYIFFSIFSIIINMFINKMAPEAKLSVNNKTLCEENDF